MPFLLIQCFFSIVVFEINKGAAFGQGNLDNILALNFSCKGTENYINNCTGDNLCCQHSNDVGITCQPACVHGQARLVNGPTPSEGRVEVCSGFRWGTVCDDFWETADARVVCKQAGLPWRGIEQRAL